MGNASGTETPLLVGRELAFKQQILTQHQPRGIVHVQHLHGDDADLGLAHQGRLFPAEVAVPVLFPRVEERVKLAFQKPRQICALGPIALRAGETEGFGIVGAAVLLGNDVFDVKRLVRILVLMKPAVFAAAASTLSDEGSERIVHHSPWGIASSCRAFDFKMAMNVA